MTRLTLDSVTINDADDGLLPTRLVSPNGGNIGSTNNGGNAMFVTLRDGSGNGVQPTEFTYLASAAFTTTQTQADQTNLFARGIKVFVNMTVVGTGSITVSIQGKDPLSGQYFTLLASAAIVANGFTVLTLYPGLTPAANSVANDVLPKTFRLLVTANNANPATYSVGYEIFP